ncbi:MAG: uroporphyrinogen-III C-methyltransferase [Uliginosibacterium sp.]|nr:uroporphyrinogen-III C-methyltransferase [Uliginosibacterium sp.]
MEPRVEPHSGLPTGLQTSRTHKRRTRRLRWTRLVIAALGAALVALAWICYDTREEMASLRTELGKRFAEGDSVARDARTLGYQNQTAIEQAQARIGGLDAKLQEYQGQYAALESMYLEFSRARDDRALTEIEQALAIAKQHLQLAGNVPAALAALQTVESRLALMDQARFLPLRKLVSRDIERLKTLPLADLATVALQLETLMGRIDGLPLGFERTIPSAKPAAAVASKPAKPARAKRQSALAETAQSAALPVERPSALARFFDDLWQDFRELIRVERLDRPDPALCWPQPGGVSAGERSLAAAIRAPGRFAAGWSFVQ